jgi:hypothetical protein
MPLRIFFPKAYTADNPVFFHLAARAKFFCSDNPVFFHLAEKKLQALCFAQEERRRGKKEVRPWSEIYW